MPTDLRRPNRTFTIRQLCLEFKCTPRALRFYEDKEHGYEYPDLYRRMFGVDYKPEPYIEHAWQTAKKHKWYYESRMVTVNDLYAFEPNVQIRLFNPPVMLHAKNISIDDDIAAIGSSNMDMRSFQLNLEITLVLYDREAVARLRAIEATYLARSTPILLEEWRKLSFGEKFVQNSARLVSALL